ncbi:hypothetical protein AB0N87_34920 [Streptomyces sp. NPDC093228]|uniref:hypothetical protein n=1 Tax=Streptomyces sp. NPDC093228 TaxID=3155070 RepID=UPI00343095F7
MREEDQDCPGARALAPQMTTVLCVGRVDAVGVGVASGGDEDVAAGAEGRRVVPGAPEGEVGCDDSASVGMGESDA